MKDLKNEIHEKPAPVQALNSKSSGEKGGSFGIHLSKEYFNFSAAHFLILPDETCERLHGHNYQVEVLIKSDTTKNGIVFDFQDLKPIIRRLCLELDHCLILPENNPLLILEAKKEVNSNQDSVFVSYKDKKYMFPASEVIILPISNSSVEQLAFYFFSKLYRIMGTQFDLTHVSNMNVKVYEASGQSGFFSKDF